MHYDLPGRTDPAKVVLHRDGREVVFPLPYPADGPDADLLAKHPLVRLVADEPKKKKAPEPAPEPQPTEPSGKEV